MDKVVVTIYDDVETVAPLLEGLLPKIFSRYRVELHNGEGVVVLDDQPKPTCYT